MKKSIFTAFLFVFTLVFTFSAATCFSQSGKSDNSKNSGGGGKSINSAEALKEYLDSQPANSPDKPIKVSMGANELMLPKIKDVLNSAGKYVSLNLTGNALTTIQDDVFEKCQTLISITIPDSVTNIGKYALSNCTNLTSVIIPNSVIRIGRGAFNECTNLASVTIPNSVTKIEESALYGCKRLTNVAIPNSVTSIENAVFRECTNLTDITIPNSIKYIGRLAFGECESLTSITIPNSVTLIGEIPFEKCTSLVTINVDPGNTNYISVQGVLYDKNKIRLIAYPAGKADNSFTIPDSVKNIDEYAFAYCSKLNSLIIPSSVTSIGKSVFYDSKITSVTFNTGSAITSANFIDTQGLFGNNLKEAYLSGGAGTYKRQTIYHDWKKQ